MSVPDPEAFARRWLDAWNGHDIDAVLAHFADDATFASPLAIRIIEGSDGRIRGKQALREYWTEALRRNTSLRFELIDVHVGIDALVINYRNEQGTSVNEVLIFGSDGLVTEGYACRNDQ